MEDAAFLGFTGSWCHCEEGADEAIALRTSTCATGSPRRLRLLAMTAKADRKAKDMASEAARYSRIMNELGLIKSP